MSSLDLHSDLRRMLTEMEKCAPETIYGAEQMQRVLDDTHGTEPL